jgi:hypothetical protein
MPKAKYKTRDDLQREIERWREKLLFAQDQIDQLQIDLIHALARARTAEDDADQLAAWLLRIAPYPNQIALMKHDEAVRARHG